MLQASGAAVLTDAGTRGARFQEEDRPTQCLESAWGPICKANFGGQPV